MTLIIQLFGENRFIQSLNTLLITRGLRMDDDPKMIYVRLDIRCNNLIIYFENVMKNFAIAVLVLIGINFPIKVKAQSFEEIQPEGVYELILYGGAAGVGTTLCALMVDNKISLSYSRQFKDDYINFFRDNYRESDVAKAGINDGISSMLDQGNQYSKCFQLRAN